MPTPSVLRQFIDTVNNEGHGLTPWETDFMISITDQFDRTNSLSPAQQEALERIYANRTD